MFRNAVIVLTSLLFVVPAEAQRHRAPPAPEPPRKVRRRAPPSAPKMPVRKAVEVSNFEPKTGSPRTTVTLFGAHFDETCRVRFNGRDLKVIARSKTEIKVRIFRKAVTDHFVVIKPGFRDVTVSKVFHVVRPPKIKDFRPKRLRVGDQVTVYGHHFLPTDKFVLGAVVLPVVSFKPQRVLVKIAAGASPNRIGIRRGPGVVAFSKGRLDVMSAPPVVSGFVPPQGSRGVTVRISGQNFEATDKVKLNGRKLRIKGRAHDFFEVIIGRRHTSGKFKVVGRHGRRALSGNIFQVISPPVVRRYVPRFGPPGTVITMFGHGFLRDDEVMLEERVLTTRSLIHNKILAELPAGVSSGRMFIRRAKRKYPVRGTFTVLLPPTISNFTPRTGPPGTRVSIQGANFLPKLSVLLAGQALKIVRRPGKDQVIAVIPPNARTGKITIHTKVGNSTSAIPFKITPFAVVSSFFPLHGLPGTRVTIRGNHFHPGIDVHLGKLPLALRRQTITELEVEIPKNAPSGKFSVVSYGRKLITAQAFAVDQPKPAVEFDFIPKTQRRGREVTLTLRPPTQAVTVFFNGRPLPKRTLDGGARIIITIPGDGRSGYLELEYKGDRYKAKQQLKVR